MRTMSYEEFENEIERLDGQGRTLEKLHLFEKASEILSEEDFRENFFNITSLKGSMYFRLGEKEKFFNIFEDLVNKGFACGAWMIRNLDMGDLRCSKLREKNELLLDEAQKNAKLEYVVHLPEGYTDTGKYPVFLGLHGDGGDGNIEDFGRHFKPDVFLKMGFIFVYVQSSQVYCHKGYQWNKDRNRAKEDIKSCLNMVSGEYSVDMDSIIVGGFSGGAMFSIDFAMSEAIPLRGFISLCPANIGNMFARESAVKASERGTRGVILEGELELDPSVQEAIKTLQEAEFPYQYWVNSGVGHWYPKDLDEKLNKSLDFILGEK